MNADEFFSLGETDARFELMDGALIVSPSPTPLHQHILIKLGAQLDAAQSAGAPIAFFADTDVRFSRTHVYPPDLSVYAASRLIGIPNKLEFAPDLVIEIISPSSKGTDLIGKREDYDRFGVNEYVVIDPTQCRAYFWQRRGERLLEQPVEADSIVSSLGITISLAPLWAICKSVTS